MIRSRIRGLTSRARAQGWWIAPQVIVVALLGITIGLWGAWMFYAAFNSLAVWLYADHRGSRNPRRQTFLKLSAIVLLPFGLLWLIATKRGPSISKNTGELSDDLEVRRASYLLTLRRGPHRS